jgi:hypothetical protein
MAPTHGLVGAAGRWAAWLLRGCCLAACPPVRCGADGRYEKIANIREVTFPQAAEEAEPPPAPAPAPAPAPEDESVRECLRACV